MREGRPRISLRFIRATTLLALLIAVVARHVFAAEEDFFRGKTVTIIVGYFYLADK